MPRKLRDFVIAVSLANLCFLWAWQVLANPLYYSYYYVKGPRNITEPIALLLNLLIVAVVFWGLTRFARRSKHRLPLVVARWTFLLSLAIPIYSILHKREADTLRSEFDLPGWVLIIIPAVAVLVLFVAYRWHRQVLKVALACVLVLSPMVVINVGYSIWLLNKYGSQPTQVNNENSPSAPASKHGRAAHIVWIVFDELDQHVAFDARPAGLHLPEFDRLRAKGLFARRAYPPTGQTLYSMPALITGRRVVAAAPISANDLLLQFDDHTWAGWSGVKNIFSSAREAGFTTALVGWYHPYCRIIGRSIDFCAWEPLTDRSDPDSTLRLLKRNMFFWARQTVYRIPFLSFVKNARDQEQRQEHIAAYRAIMKDGLKLAANPNWNLILIHFPIPHGPWIYDSNAQQLSSSDKHIYQDNVMLADHALGVIRRSIEAAGIWDDSTVVVSSDHWWRKRPNAETSPDHRVPFILKLAGQDEGIVYERPMTTLVTRELLLSILRGEIAKPEDLTEWLDRRSMDITVEAVPDLP